MLKQWTQRDLNAFFTARIQTIDQLIQHGRLQRPSTHTQSIDHPHLHATCCISNATWYSERPGKVFPG